MKDKRINWKQKEGDAEFRFMTTWRRRRRQESVTDERKDERGERRRKL